MSVTGPGVQTDWATFVTRLGVQTKMIFMPTFRPTGLGMSSGDHHGKE
jgi:hypothetical protein